MKTDIFNFFNPQSNEDSLSLLKNCISDKIKLQAVEEGKIQAFSCFLDNKFAAKKFYLSQDKVSFDLTKKYSFCIKVINKIYFFKSQIFEDTKGIYLNDEICIHELRRRKDTRFDLPSEWRQSCLVYQNIKRAPKLNARIINISWSGIRVEVEPQLPEFKMNQEIQFAVQIHKRAEVLCHGVIKYIKKNKNSGPVLGIEFIKLNRLSENKIQNFCEDLLRYFVLKQKNLT